MRHSWAFALLLGGVIGAFAVIVATDPVGADALPPLPPPPATATVAQATTQVDVTTGSIAIDLGVDDATLARELERAHFDRDWTRAAAVGTVLRARAAGVAATPGLPGDGHAELPSLVRLDHTFRRVSFERDLAARENAATRAAAQQDDDRLRALFLGPSLAPGDDLVRADAAHLLARLGTERGRRVLLEAVEGPDAAMGELAAQALARSDDPPSVDALVALMRSDRDPTLRARVIDALSHSADLVQARHGVPDALAATALDDRDLAVRTHALAVLARCDLAALAASREALAKIVTTETDDATVREAAVAALRAHFAIARALPPDLVAALVTALDRTAGPLRLRVIEVLAEAGDATTLPRLEAAALAATVASERTALRSAADVLRRRAAPE